MTHRLAIVGLLAISSPAPALASQPRSAVDSLVARVTQSWGAAPTSGWRAEWSVIRGDSTLLRADQAEFSGSERSGIYTVTMRGARFGAPTLVGRLRVGHERNEVVALHTIARGHTLDDADVALRRAVVWGAPIRSASTDSAAPLLASTRGRAARRVIHEGETLRDGDTEAPPVVVAGDSVTAEIVRNGVRLVVPGFALQNASIGGRVAIRLARGRRFAAIATGRHTVRID
jgi:flagella basal body P-ring formation protein FlgA